MKMNVFFAFDKAPLSANNLLLMDYTNCMYINGVLGGVCHGRFAIPIN